MGTNIKVAHDTIFKPGTKQSTEYNEVECRPAEKGEMIPIVAYVVEENHVKFTLDIHNTFKLLESLKEFHPSGRNTWYAYAPHIEDSAGWSTNNNPKDIAPFKPRKGFDFTLPGFNGKYNSNDPIIYRNGKPGNFTWGEALHFTPSGSYRKPFDHSVVRNIIRIAHIMQDIREMYDRPITINSWYRDPVTNRAVGGASQSRHMVGDAVDFVVQGVAPSQVNQRLDPWWGSRGGLASSSVFTHIDARGYKARWSYGY